MKKSNLIGIDISRYNNLSVLDKGWDFAIHKMSQGTDYLDHQFANFIAKTQHTEMCRGCYHYVTSSPAELQAKHIVSMLDEFNLRGKILFALDWEAGDLLVSKNHQNIESLKSIVNEVNKLLPFWQPIVYTSKTEALAICHAWYDAPDKICLWLADYKNNNLSLAVNSIWKPIMTQFTTSGETLDIDSYHGTEDSWKEFEKTTKY